MKDDKREEAANAGENENESPPAKKHLFKTRSFPNTNFLNENLKIRLPIFSIHGNHDDPIGLEMVGSLDLCSTNNYINYFGKVTNIEHIEIQPVLFEKGSTKIAIFGIGHMRDERINLAFENKQIKFKRPR